MLPTVLLFAVGCSSTAWKRTVQVNTETAYATFLREHPRSHYAPMAERRIREIQAEARAEQVKADWVPALRADTIEAYEQFLQRHPGSQQSIEAELRLRDLRATQAWKDARKKNTIEGYEAFLLEYSTAPFAAEARSWLSFLKGEARVVLDSPSSMSPWGASRYRWEATFRETRGKYGFRVRATDFYVIGKGGTRWTNSWSKSIEVKPGGSMKVDFWIDKSGKWAGGKFHCIWVGMDDKGNPIRIVHEVNIP